MREIRDLKDKSNTDEKRSYQQPTKKFKSNRTNDYNYHSQPVVSSGKGEYSFFVNATSILLHAFFGALLLAAMFYSFAASF